MAGADQAGRIDGFIDKFEPETAALIRACRAALRDRFPTAHELIYDNYNFLVFGFSTTTRASDAILSLTGGANGVALMFPYCGAKIDDPERLLQGSGTQNRFIRLPSADTLRLPAVRRLIDAAVAANAHPLPATGEGSTTIASVSAKQRPRRKAPP